MLTGELRNKVDRLWDTFWTGGISNPLASRPVGLHHQPLSERCVNLSIHTAPIRQTYRSCQAANARRNRGAARIILAKSGSRASCGL